MRMILILVTCGSRREAGRISGHLLKRRLVACANIFNVESSYWWRRKIEHRREWMMVMKSTRKNFVPIKAAVKRLHSYEVPEVVMVDARADGRYDRWVRALVG